MKYETKACDEKQVAIGPHVLKLTFETVTLDSFALVSQMLCIPITYEHCTNKQHDNLMIFWEVKSKTGQPLRQKFDKYGYMWTSCKTLTQPFLH